MGRQKQNTVYKYFDINKNCSKSKCLMCKKDLNSINGSNLIKHLKIHKKEYEDVLSLNSTQKSNTKKSFNTEIVSRECTKLVTFHGRPLALIDDEAFQNILSLIPDCNLKINSKYIRKDIIETAGNLRMALARELQDKIICIKIDIASLALRSFMGVNAQYLEKGAIVLKNLAMVELLERHTSENLKEQMFYVLQRFRIGLENVYSFTTDNRANMLKMGKLLNETLIQQNQSVSLSTNDEDHSDRDRSMFTEDDDQNDTVMEVMADTENDSEHSDSDLDYDADTGLDTDDIQNQYTETITSSLSVHFHENTTQQRNIPAVRCAAHTLQLSVLHVCNNTQVKEVIDDARKAAKILRTQIHAAIIAKAQKKQAILDCPTRWNSTIDMIKRLIELKDICDNARNDNLNLTETTWNTLQDYLISLSPAKELSKVLQQEQLTIGDFYLQWLLCKIKLRNINTALSTLLVNSMENREHTLINNDAFICAVFLDGRVNSTPSDDQRESAKSKLLELYHYLINLNNNKENEPHSSSSSSLPQTNTNDNSARNELENFLSVKYVEAQSDIQVLLQRRINVPVNVFRNLDEELTAFLKEPLLKSTENILNYWEMNKNNYPRLYKVASVVLATPATQVSVERLFSSLKFVVSRHRFNLKRSLIEDIIFI